MSELRINFNPKFLPVLEAFKAQRDIRYYLCGVYVEKAPQGGVYLVAADGHTMAVVYDRTGLIEGADHAIVSVDAGLVAAAKKAPRKSSKEGLDYCVTVRGTRAMVAVPDTEGFELFIQPGRCVIEGKYPEWRRVVPDFEKLKPGALAEDGVNAIYLARFAKVVPDKRFCGVTLWQEGASKPVIAQVNGLPEAFFVVMPMRGRADDAGLRQFMLPKQAPTQIEEAVAEAA